MDSHCDRRPAELPVISGARWFGSAEGPFVIRVEVPLTFEQAVATLHGIAGHDDLLADEDLVGCVAVTLLLEGLPGIEARATTLRGDEERGAIRAPAFLAYCRERVTTLLRSYRPGPVAG